MKNVSKRTPAGLAGKPEPPQLTRPADPLARFIRVCGKGKEGKRREGKGKRDGKNREN